MKFAICLLACLVAVNGAPISITGNTIKDIYSGICLIDSLET